MTTAYSALKNATQAGLGALVQELPDRANARRPFLVTPLPRAK